MALFVGHGTHHLAAVEALNAARQPLVVPVGILSDIDRALTGHLSRIATIALLEAIQRGETFLDCGDLDLPRIRELLTRFGDLPLRLSVAAVVACAERNGGSILSFDRSELEVIAHDVPITMLP